MFKLDVSCFLDTGPQTWKMGNDKPKNKITL